MSSITDPVHLTLIIAAAAAAVLVMWFPFLI